MITCLIEWQSLGAFEKQLQKATVDLVISVRLSAWNSVTPTGGVFMNVWEFQKMLPARVCFGWYRRRITGHFTWTPTYIYWLAFIMKTVFSVRCGLRFKQLLTIQTYESSMSCCNSVAEARKIFTGSITTPTHHNCYALFEFLNFNFS